MFNVKIYLIEFSFIEQTEINPFVDWFDFGSKVDTSKTEIVKIV